MNGEELVLGDLVMITDRDNEYYNWVGLLCHISSMRDMLVTLGMSKNPGQ